MNKKGKIALLISSIVAIAMVGIITVIGQSGPTPGETDNDPDVGKVPYTIEYFANGEDEDCTIDCNLGCTTRRSYTQECTSSATNDVNDDGNSDSNDDDTSGGSLTPVPTQPSGHPGSGWTDPRKGVRMIGGVGHGYGEAQAGGSDHISKSYSPCDLQAAEKYCIQKQKEFKTDQCESNEDGTIGGHADEIARENAAQACSDYDTSPSGGTDPQPYNPSGNPPLGHPTTGGNWAQGGSNNANNCGTCGTSSTQPGPNPHTSTQPGPYTSI